MRKLSFPISYKLAFLFGFGSLVLAYGSLVFPNYLVLDDALSLSDVLQKTDLSSMWALKIGRPVNALYIHYGFKWFNLVSKLWLIRTVTLATLIVCFFAFYSLMRRFLDVGSACCVAVATFLLPPFVVSVMFAQIACYPVGFLLSTVAAAIIDKHVRSDRTLSEFWYLSAAITLVVIALFTNQPAAQAIFCLPILYALHLRETDTLQKTVRCLIITVCVFAVAGLVYYGVWQTYLHIFFDNPALGQRVMISSLAQVTAKIVWFFGVLTEAGRLFAFDESNVLPGIVYAVVFLHFMFLRQSAVEKLTRIAFWIVLLPASYAANLLVAESWSEYRTQFALQACLWISFAAGIGTLWRVLVQRWAPRAQTVKEIVAVCAVLALVVRQAFLIGPDFVAPHAREFEALKFAMWDFERDRGTASRLVLLRADWTANAPSYTRYDLIGSPASGAPWAAIPMARLAYWEDFRRPIPISVTDQPYGDPLPPHDANSDYVLDLDALLRAWSQKSRVHLPR